MSHLRTWTAVALLLTGCADAGAVNRWEGDLVTAVASEEFELCPGTIDFWDAFAQETYRLWHGERPASDLSLEVTLIPTEENDTPYIGYAKPLEHTAWAAKQPAVMHELVHLAVGAHDGYSSPALAEGVATGFAPANSARLWWTEPYDPEAFVFAPRGDFDTQYQSSAAQLMRFLSEDYGLQQLRSAYQRASTAASAEQVEAAMVEAFGDGLYDTFETYLDTFPVPPLQAWECSGSLLPEIALPVVVPWGQGCEMDGAIGVTSTVDDEHWYAVRMFTTEIPEGTERLEITTSDHVEVWIEQCVPSYRDGTTNSAWILASDSDEIAEFEWPRAPETIAPGRYVITIRATSSSKPYTASIALANAP